jgi:hypothetical protein
LIATILGIVYFVLHGAAIVIGLAFFGLYGGFAAWLAVPLVLLPLYGFVERRTTRAS